MTAVVLALDCLLLLSGLILGFVVAAGLGMAQGDSPAGPRPISALQNYSVVASGFGAAMLFVAPTIVLLWYGKPRIALPIVGLPLLLAASVLWALRGSF